MATGLEEDQQSSLAQNLGQGGDLEAWAEAPQQGVPGTSPVGKLGRGCPGMGLHWDHLQGGGVLVSGSLPALRHLWPRPGGVPGPSSSCPPLLGCPSISPTRSFLSPPRVAGPAPRRSCPLKVAGQLGSSTTPASGQPGERPCNGLRSSSTLWDAPTPPVGPELSISEDWRGKTCVGAPQPLSELWGRRGGGRGLYANPSPWGPSTFCGRVQDRDERRKFSLLLENSLYSAQAQQCPCPIWASGVHVWRGPGLSFSIGGDAS